MHNFVMIGAGGTGTALARPLHTYLRAKYPNDYMLYVIDGDTVESKNLERQLFAPGDVTLNKAHALVRSLDDMNVEAVPEYLSEQNIDKYIRDRDTVFICVDNFTVRKRIEDHVKTLNHAVVINGGNEATDGSVQCWIRSDGNDKTPYLSFLHPEVRIGEGDDRAEMTCQQAAQLPGGEQTIIANLQSATWMLTMLWKSDQSCNVVYHEIQFDVAEDSVDFIDYTGTKAWANR